ncbi:DUF444 family protein [Paenibacillus sp. GCM10027627]|uniref:DUF444 family protein n=1 Tax=unclassified Paenibacillus TaxID=185978 RepID=UPI003633F63E
MKLKQIESLDNEKLLEMYAIGFGKLALDNNDENLQKNLLNIKSELLKRLNPQNKVFDRKLYELIADENVIIDKMSIDQITSQLLSHLKTVSGIGKTGEVAKIIVCIDHSGSMGSYEKYCAKGFMTWIDKILSEKYKIVSSEFIGFHTEARFLDEASVYGSTDSGGTIVSSGLHKVNELINNYNYEEIDTYVFLISDGDNLTSDNDRVVRLLKDIERKITKLTYLEINQYNRSSTIKNGLKRAQLSDKFQLLTISEKNEFLDVLELFCKQI